MNFITNWFRSRRLAQAKADANEALIKARNAYHEAKKRGDTRDLHQASASVHQAVHAMLRAELGR